MEKYMFIGYSNCETYIVLFKGKKSSEIAHMDYLYCHAVNM